VLFTKYESGDKARRKGWVGHVAPMGERRTYWFLIGKFEEKQH
jgi:hypothetical protein